MKKRLLKHTLMLLLCWCWFTVAQAQESEPQWTFIKTEEDIKFYYSVGTCENDGTWQIFLKVKNIGSSPVEGSYIISIEEDGIKRSEYFYLEQLSSGIEKQGGCNYSSTNKMIFNLKNSSGFTITIDKIK